MFPRSLKTETYKVAYLLSVCVIKGHTRREFRKGSKVHCKGAHPPYGSLSRRGLHSIQLMAINKLTASTFHRLSQYVMGPTTTQNSPFIPNVSSSTP